MIKNVYVLYLIGYLILSLQNVQAQKITVMRHGESEHNLVGVNNSNPKDPRHKTSNLTENGITQVRSSAKKLIHSGVDKDKVDIAVVSPFPRAIQTAKILIEEGVIKPESIIYDDRLREMLILEKEGKRVNLDNGEPWEGETFEDVKIRSIAALKNYALKYHNIIFVTHGVPGNQIIDFMTDKKSDRLKLAEARTYYINE